MRTSLALFALALSSHLCLSTSPKAQTLLRDIHQGEVGDLSSFPGEIAGFGSNVFFAATKTGLGTEMFVTDGTSPGTSLFLDACVGPCSGLPNQMLVISGTLFFVATTPTNGAELWKSDGTAGGTTLVHDINSNGGAAIGQLLEFSGQPYFTARLNQFTGTQVWRSDGTAAGTIMVTNINPSFTGLAPRELTVSGSKLFFAGEDGVLDHELWATDGTTTQQLTTTAFAGDGEPHGLIDLGGTLLFWMETVSNGNFGLWSSDGTPAGTQLVTGGFSFPATEPVRVGAEVFFFVGGHLWKTDGTAPGTVQVSGLLNGTSAIEAGGRLYFQSSDELWTSDGTGPGTVSLGSFGTSLELEDAASFAGELYFRAGELWKSDGTLGGTVEVVDIRPRGDSAPLNLLSHNGKLWFSADDGTSGRELWQSDGTAPGTSLVHNLQVGPLNESSEPALWAQFPGKGIFLATDEDHGRELWVSDGTAQGTELFFDINPGPVESLPSLAVPFRDGYAFTAYTGFLGDKELWFTDGTAAGTVEYDLSPSSSSSVAFLTVVDERLFFTATVGGDRELWSWDGTAAPALVANIRPDGSSFPTLLTPFGDQLLFKANDGTNGDQLWVSDGTAQGTQLATSLPSEVQSLLLVHDGLAYIRAETPSDGTELAFTDGTPAGTVVLDLNPGLFSSLPEYLTPAGTEVFFAAWTTDEGVELWATDGTAGGTRLVKNLRGGSLSSNPENFIALGNKVVFEASALGASVFVSDGTGSGTQALGVLQVEEWMVLDGRVVAFHEGGVWSTDGTPSGTMTLHTPASGQEVERWSHAGDRIYFTSFTELWSTDGTPAGTQLVVDTDPNNIVLPGVFPVTGTPYPVGLGPEIAFSGDDGQGAELWISDGTTGGTFLYADIGPGLASSSPGGFFHVGGNLLFSAEGATGRELYAMPYADTGGYRYGAFGHGCPANTGGLTPRMSPAGEARLGATFSMGFSAAPANSFGILCYAMSPSQTALGACTFYLPAGFQVAGTAQANGQGDGAFNVTIPNDPSFLGQPVYAQYIVTDPGGPLGGLATLSDALEVLVGP